MHRPGLQISFQIKQATSWTSRAVAFFHPISAHFHRPAPLKSQLELSRSIFNTRSDRQSQPPRLWRVFWITSGASPLRMRFPRPTLVCTRLTMNPPLTHLRDNPNGHAPCVGGLRNIEEYQACICLRMLMRRRSIHRLRRLWRRPSRRRRHLPRSARHRRRAQDHPLRQALHEMVQRARAPLPQRVPPRRLHPRHHRRAPRLPPYRLSA